MGGERVVLIASLVLLGCATKPREEAPPAPVPAPVEAVWKEKPAPIHLEAEQWPAIVDVNGDGLDDIVALGRIESDGDSRSQLVAYDGKDGSLLWLSPRIQSSWTVPQRARVMVFAAGDQIALANGWRELEVFSAKTGARTKKIEIDGIPGQGSCIDPARPEHLFLTLYQGSRDRSGLRGVAAVDLATGQAAAGEPPTWCPPIATDACESWRANSPLTRCGDAEGTPAADRWGHGFFLRANGVAIASSVDRDSATERHARVVRFDPATKRILWERKITKLAGLPEKYFEEDDASRLAVTEEGVALAFPARRRSRSGQYEGDVFEHFLLLDLETGASRFDLRLTPTVGDAYNIRAVHGALYVMRGGVLEARSPSSGDVRRTFGGETILEGHIIPR